MASPSQILTALLPAGTDADILEYLSGTVEASIDEGDVSVGALSEAISELLVSYELVADEAEALTVIEQLHEQLAPAAAAAAPTSVTDAPPALLGEKVTMGVDNERVDMTGMQSNVDAFGNRVSAAALANANWRPSSLKAVANAEKEEVDEDAGGVQFGLLDLRSRAAELAKREQQEAAAAEQARERACALYLDSKMAGGTRDVAVRSMLLLAPNGKPLLDEEGQTALRLVEGRKYGLVGRNGTGKTTLLRAISSYEITGFPAHLKVVHVEQVT
jgi:ABC-type multidrug transport system fused ATPase/permease subunit